MAGLEVGFGLDEGCVYLFFVEVELFFEKVVEVQFGGWMKDYAGFIDHFSLYGFMAELVVIDVDKLIEFVALVGQD